jgi:hypothetical protein
LALTLTFAFQDNTATQQHGGNANDAFTDETKTWTI